MTNTIQEDPYPITENKIIAFIVYQKETNNRSYSTLKQYIQAFSSYFKDHDVDNIVLSMSFKIFKNGLRREMSGGYCPKAKKPFDPAWFNLIYESIPPTNAPDQKFFFLMTLSFYCFLRISEVINLKKSDLKYDDEKEILKVHISCSKTDQDHTGADTYVTKNNSLNCPINYMNFLQNLRDDEFICNNTYYLRQHLHAILKSIGIDDVANYNWHSFRRGGAYYASLNGVQDCVIKHQGRWKSEAYIRYVSVDGVRAGNEISNALRF